MVTTVGAVVVFIVCMIGCAYHAYFLGRRVGIEHAVDFLADNDYIDVDD